MFTYNNAVTATNPPGGDELYSIQPSEKSRIQTWYLDPISKLEKPEQALICLALTFMLMDKCFRCTYGMTASAGYSENCGALRELAKEFPSLDVKDAGKVWGDLRNGIMHKGMPNKSDFAYEFDPIGNKAIQKNGKIIAINPWRLRDWAIKKHEDNFKAIWKLDSDNKILGVYSVQ